MLYEDLNGKEKGNKEFVLGVEIVAALPFWVVSTYRIVPCIT